MGVYVALVVLYIYLVFSKVQADVAGDICKLESTSSSGQCTLLNNCPKALKELQEGKIPPFCGVQEKEPVVCCAVEPQEERISRKKCKENAEAASVELNPLPFSPNSKPVKGIICPQLVNPLFIDHDIARSQEFPHMALLGYGPQDDIQWMGGGSLISEQFVLTAAHCIYLKIRDSEVRWIRLGEHNIASTTDDALPQDFSVVERIQHPLYNSSSTYNDIALLKINRAVPFSRYIRPACLYTGVPALRPSQRFIVTGWAHTDFNYLGENVTFLRKLVLEYFSHSECNASYEDNIGRRLRLGILPDSQICAGSRKKEKDLRHGACGSPLQIYSDLECMYDVVGVIAFGKSWSTFGIPSVYTSVLHYLDWIEKIVWSQ